MPMKRDKYGLGYKPSMGKDDVAKIPVGNIQETFYKVGFANFAKKPKVPTMFWKDNKLLAKGEDSKVCEQLWNMPMKRDKYGLGYKPSMGEGDAAKTPFGNIQENFYKAGLASDDQVAVIEDVSDDGKIPCLTYCCSPNFSLNNWTTVEIPEIFSFSK
jgi:hypothetical protein